jgi:hypothetical protein
VQEKKFMKLPMGTKKQFKMYLDDELVERLRQVAERLGKGSGQEVAEEVISTYLQLWIAVTESTRRAIDFQTRQIFEETTRNSRAEQAPQNRHEQKELQIPVRPIGLDAIEESPHKKRKQG